MPKKKVRAVKTRRLKGPTECKTCSNWADTRAKLRVSGLLEKTIKAFETRMDTNDFKPTIAEYLKLVQLEQEAEQESAKEIKVTWVDPTVTSNSEK